jgi:hypothetical protein
MQRTRRQCTRMKRRQWRWISLVNRGVSETTTRGKVDGCPGGDLQEREGEEVAPQHDTGDGLPRKGKLTKRGKTRWRGGGRAGVPLVR